MKAHKRNQLLGNVRRAVVHIGKGLHSEPFVARVRSLAQEVASLRQGGIDVVLAASGAIQVGMIRLDLKRQPRQVPLLQAASVVGQVALIHTYDDALSAHGLPVAQVMVGREDLRDCGRFLRLRHTLMALLDYGVVPVVGENQAVSVEGIISRHDDILAAHLPRLVEADLLVLLTTVEGIYASSPRRGGVVLSLVEDINALAPRIQEGRIRGKVQQKVADTVEAARTAAADGVPTVVCSGLRPGVLRDLFDDDSVGTLLLPSRLQRSRKQWIAQDLSPKGSVSVREPVRRSLVEDGHSLLAAGVQEITGQFVLGDAVRVMDDRGEEFARGLVGYSSTELGHIKGKEPPEIERALGYRNYEEVIRRDDLVIL